MAFTPRIPSTTFPPANLCGTSTRTNLVLVGTSNHLASTDLSATIFWQVLPRRFHEQRFKSYAGSFTDSHEFQKELPQQFARASCLRSLSLPHVCWKHVAETIQGLISVLKYRWTNEKTKAQPADASTRNHVRVRRRATRSTVPSP